MLLPRGAQRRNKIAWTTPVGASIKVADSHSAGRERIEGERRRLNAANERRPQKRVGIPRSEELRWRLRLTEAGVCLACMGEGSENAASVRRLLTRCMHGFSASLLRLRRDLPLIFWRPPARSASNLLLVLPRSTPLPSSFTASSSPFSTRDGPSFYASLSIRNPHLHPRPEASVLAIACLRRPPPACNQTSPVTPPPPLLPPTPNHARRHQVAVVAG